MKNEGRGPVRVGHGVRRPLLRVAELLRGEVRRGRRGHNEPVPELFYVDKLRVDGGMRALCQN